MKYVCNIEGFVYQKIPKIEILRSNCDSLHDTSE